LVIGYWLLANDLNVFSTSRVKTRAVPLKLT